MDDANCHTEGLGGGVGDVLRWMMQIVTRGGVGVGDVLRLMMQIVTRGVGGWGWVGNVRC